MRRRGINHKAIKARKGGKQGGGGGTYVRHVDNMCEDLVGDGEIRIVDEEGAEKVETLIRYEGAYVRAFQGVH